MQPQKTLILVGGGHVHALFLKLWHKRPVPDTKLIVIDPHAKVPYTGMLPGFIAGHYSADDLYINLEQLTSVAKGTLVVDRVVDIDPGRKTVVTEAGQSYQYDVLSIDVGVHARLTLPNFAEPVVAVKPLYDFAKQWEEFVVKRAEDPQLSNVVIIGGGVAGVELALATRYRLEQSRILGKVTILERGQVLQHVGTATKRYLCKLLSRRGIGVIEDQTVVGITAGSVKTKEGLVSGDFILSAIGPRPHAWLAETELRSTDGYVTVTDTLQSPTYPEVFAVGDCAHFEPRPLPKAGVYAVRQAPVLYHNVRAFLEDSTMRSFQPQRDYLKLISLGGKQAAADKWGWCWRGAWLWHLKNYIDTNFMNKFK